jgi:hypothetical protein
VYVFFKGIGGDLAVILKWSKIRVSLKGYIGQESPLLGNSVLWVSGAMAWQGTRKSVFFALRQY